MVLNYNAYCETPEKQQEKESEIHLLKEKYEQGMIAMWKEMEDKFQKIIEKIEVASLKKVYYSIIDMRHNERIATRARFDNHIYRYFFCVSLFFLFYLK